ncbi:hypothetical protein LTS18_015093, partial [Coniosporium uncinatum]
WTAPTWAGIEYDGRWKMLHYGAKDIFANVIVAPYYNVTTGELQVWVTSDLWSPVRGTVNITWFDYAGNRLDVSTPPSFEVEVGAINSTRILRRDVGELLAGYDAEDVVMKMSVAVTGSLPNRPVNETRVFAHENWWHAAPLSRSALRDPGLRLSRDNATKSFTVEARGAVAAWVWLDHPDDVGLSFEANGFWMERGEKRVVGYCLWSGGADGRWVDGVEVRSMWDNTLP